MTTRYATANAIAPSFNTTGAVAVNNGQVLPFPKVKRQNKPHTIRISIGINMADVLRSIALLSLLILPHLF